MALGVLGLESRDDGVKRLLVLDIKKTESERIKIHTSYNGLSSTDSSKSKANCDCVSIEKKDSEKC